MTNNILVTMSPAAIAVNRFGLGLNSGSSQNTLAINASLSQSKQWLSNQLSVYQAAPAAWANQAKTADVIAQYQQTMQAMKQADDGQKQTSKQQLRKEIRSDYEDAVTARAMSAITSNTSFVERLVHFWANHFAISIEKPAMAELAGAFELEAIRPFILGSFTDLLLAVEKHPAMLTYLDQVKSIGPNSPAAARLAQRANDSQPDKKRGLNENLAREIMELHTLGVRSGYSQEDVTEFARALTGWSMAGLGNQKTNAGKTVGQQLKRGMFNKKNQQAEVIEANGFAFRPLIHEPGSRTILGKTYDENPENAELQASNILRDLATSDATAQHIAFKLARHFVSDTPPTSLVDKLANAYRANKGNLTQVYQTLIDAPEAWNAAPAKFKTPWEWLISSLRGLSIYQQNSLNMRNINVAHIMNQLGEPVWKPGSPAGYDDIAESWAAPNALLRRVELAQRLANPLGDKVDARTLSEQLLLGSMSTQTKTAIARSESAATGLALLLVSPEFLRR